LIMALALVLGAATLWLATAIAKPALNVEKHKTWWPQADLAVRRVSAVAFLAGIIVGVLGMWRTQNDQPRPAVAAEFNQATSELTATATAQNLSVGERLVTLIVGLKQLGNGGAYVVERRYVAVSGPDAGGDATQTVNYRFPKDVYTAVGVSASTGHSRKDICDFTQEIDSPPAAAATTTTDTSAVQTVTSQAAGSALPAGSKTKRGPIVSVIAQRDLPGCAVILLSPEAAPK
jgi:hypothetical protein